MRLNTIWHSIKGGVTMAAARERRIALYAYNTRADAEANTNGTEYTSGIVDDTPRFEHVFFTEFPGWGEANAAMFSCDISGTTDLSDKWVRVKYSYYATDAATNMTNKWLFLGRVDSCKYDNLKTVRTLVAYDLLYYLRSVDVSDWWSTYWADKPASYYMFGTVFRDMCSAYSVLTNIHPNTLPSPTINTNGAKATQLSGCSFADMLAFVGQLVGAYFYIDGAGVLRFAYIDNRSTPAAVDDNMDTANTEIGDTALPAYAAMMAYSGADVIYSAGTGEPVYTIRDNPLLNGKTTAQIATQLDALRTQLARVSGFWPLTLECIVSAPDVIDTNQDRARLLTTADGNNTRLHALGSVELWGTQLINQRAVCPADMVTGAAVSASMSAALNAIQQMGVEMTYKVNADNVIEAVNLEAQGGVTINAQAINIHGVVSANGNFKVDTDGNMEAANGKFTGQITATSGTIGNVEIDGAKLVAQQSGSTYGDALFIAETATEKAYFGAGLVRIEAPPDFAGVGTVSILTKESLTSENRISGNGYTSSFDLRRMDNRGGASLGLSETNKTSAGTERSSVDVQTQGLAPSITMRHIPAGQTLADKQVTISPSGFEAVDSGTPTKITKTELIAGGKNVLQLWQSLVGGWFLRGTITSNANLNATDGTWCKIGRYSCSTAVAGTLTNSPYNMEFTMTVRTITGAAIDDESGTWKYRLREIESYNGYKWVQHCWTAGTAGSWQFNPWRAVPYAQMWKDRYSNTNIKNGECVARRNGQIVYINSAEDAVGVAAGTLVTYVTLDAKYRPNETIRWAIQNKAGNDTSTQFVTINTNGTVQLYSSVAITRATNFAFGGTYIVD